jgi:hypothetical protein
MVVCVGWLFDGCFRWLFDDCVYFSLGYRYWCRTRCDCCFYYLVASVDVTVFTDVVVADVVGC